MKKQRNLVRTTALAFALGGLFTAPTMVSSMTADDAPESVTIDFMENLYSPVEFNHAMHTEYASCQECHHHTTNGTVSDPNCARCHHDGEETDMVACAECHASDRFNEDYLKTLENPKLYHIDKPGLKGAYHLNCISCHEMTSGPTGCQECHTMTDAGEKLFNTGKYSPAPSASDQQH